jgi:hypothetical protein
MKRQGLTILALVLALTTGVAWAQWGEPAIKADVPFAYTAGDKTIPAGPTVVTAANLGGGALWIGNQDANSGTFLMAQRTESSRPSNRTVLVFHKYGNRYFFSRVERDGSSTGYRIPESKLEKELSAQNTRNSEEIRLAAK